MSDNYQHGNFGSNADSLSQRIKEGIAKESSNDAALDPEDRKFLGIIPASSPTMRGMLQGGWTAGFEYFSGSLQKFFFNQFRNIGQPHIHNPANLKFTASAAATVVTLGVATIPYWGDLFGSYKKFNKEKNTISKKLKPVLEEIKGNASPSTLMGISKEENEVLYAHRMRMQSDFQANLGDDCVKLLVSNAPSALSSLARSGNLSVPTPGGDGTKLGFTTISGLAPTFAEALNSENKKAHKAKRQPHSALELIMHLDEQVRDVSFKDDQGQDSFSMPGNGGSKPLAEYIAEIFRQHQRDMDSIDPEHSQLRSALDPQLKEISESIAESIKRGDLAVMSIVRLAGEGHVIKNKGRALNKPSEVKAYIEKMSGHALNYLQVDAKEYFAESSFSKRDLKDALHVLDGDEKLMFASMIPDSALRESGMDDAKIKETREATQKLYEQKLSHIVVGLAAQPDDALKNLGLAEEEIKQLRTVAEHVKKDGDKAIHEFRANPANTAGIERVVTNAVVNKVQGDKTYLGQIMTQGVSAMKAPVDTALLAEEKTASPKKRDDVSAKDDASKEDSKASEENNDFAKDDEDAEKTSEKPSSSASSSSRDHASREISRRSAASQDEGLSAVPA